MYEGPCFIYKPAGPLYLMSLTELSSGCYSFMQDGIRAQVPPVERHRPHSRLTDTGSFLVNSFAF